MCSIETPCCRGPLDDETAAGSAVRPPGEGVGIGQRRVEEARARAAAAGGKLPAASKRRRNRAARDTRRRAQTYAPALLVKQPRGCCARTCCCSASLAAQAPGLGQCRQSRPLWVAPYDRHDIVSQNWKPRDCSPSSGGPDRSRYIGSGRSLITSKCRWRSLSAATTPSARYGEPCA